MESKAVVEGKQETKQETLTHLGRHNNTNRQCCCHLNDLRTSSPLLFVSLSTRRTKHKTDKACWQAIIIPTWLA